MDSSKLLTLANEIFRARSIKINVSEVESFEYFSPQGLPWVCLAWACIYLFRPITTLVHELGHALVAIILTKEKVFLL